MLTMFRQMLRTRAAGLLFAVLIVAMAAWGITDVFGGGLGNNLAAAGNRTLSEQQFDNLVERELQSLTDDRGRSLTKEQALEQGVIDQLLIGARNRLAYNAYGDRLGISPTQDAIREEIVGNAVFQDTTAVFDLNRYNLLLRDNGYTTAEFEDEISSSLTAERLSRLPAAALRAPSVLTQIEARFQLERRGANWFVLPLNATPSPEAPAEEDLQTLYSELQERLREPQRRQVSLLRVSPEDFTGQVDVLDDDVEAFYEAYRAERYTGPDTRTFTVYQFDSEAAARTGLGRIAGGADPSALEGLTNTRVETGREELVDNETLRVQVFAPGAPPNSIFGPQPDGPLWTVIRLEEVIEGESTPLEEVRDEIAAELALELATEQFYETLPRLDDLIGIGATLEEIGEDVGAPVITYAAVDSLGRTASGAINRDLQTNPELLQQLFQREAGQTTQRLNEEEIVWLGRVDAIEESRLPSIEDVTPLLTEVWVQRNAERARQELSAEIVSRLESGETSLADEAARFNAVLQSLPQPVRRSEVEGRLTPQASAQLFNMDAEGDIAVSSAGSEGSVILQVSEIVIPTEAELLGFAGQLQAQQREALSNDLFEAYFFEISNDVDLQLNDSAIASYKQRLTTNP